MYRAYQLLGAIGELAKSILSLPVEDRVLFYQEIYPLILGLKDELRRSPNQYAAQKLAALEFHLMTMALLDEPDGDSDKQHYYQTVGILNELKSPDGFGNELR